MNKNIQGETFEVDIHRLDEKGFGQAVVWRENEEGNERKLKLTIPYTLPGEKVRVTVEEPHKRRWKSKADDIYQENLIDLSKELLSNFIEGDYFNVKS